jgi:hypothetical protein
MDAVSRGITHDTAETRSVEVACVELAYRRGKHES